MCDLTAAGNIINVIWIVSGWPVAWTAGWPYCACEGRRKGSLAPLFARASASCMRYSCAVACCGECCVL